MQEGEASDNAEADAVAKRDEAALEVIMAVASEREVQSVHRNDAAEVLAAAGLVMPGPPPSPERGGGDASGSGRARSSK